MQKITTFLTFNDGAEEAVNLYTSIFKDSKIGPVSRGPNGGFITASFQLNGQEFIALNGGPHFNFSEGISLFVSCETQEEVDNFWEKLSEGGSKGRCGWLKDKFGVSWQVVPTALGRFLRDKDPERSKRAMEAMMQMNKIDIKKLQDAADGK